MGERTLGLNPNCQNPNHKQIKNKNVKIAFFNIEIFLFQNCLLFKKLISEFSLKRFEPQITPKADASFGAFHELTRIDFKEFIKDSDN